MVTKVISEYTQIDLLLKWVDKNATAILKAGKQFALDAGVHEPLRTDLQNRKEHALIADINKYGVYELSGRRVVMRDYDFESCKSILVMWFAREREAEGRPLKKRIRIVQCPFSGMNISLRPSTATDFNEADTSEFIEWLYATGSEGNVKWSSDVMRFYEELQRDQNK